MRKTSSPGREATLTLWTGYWEDVDIDIDVKLSWFVCSTEYTTIARKSLILTDVSSVNECGKCLKVMLVLLRTGPLMWSSHDRHIMVGHIWLDSTLIKSLFLIWFKFCIRVLSRTQKLTVQCEFSYKPRQSDHFGSPLWWECCVYLFYSHNEQFYANRNARKCA